MHVNAGTLRCDSDLKMYDQLLEDRTVQRVNEQIICTGSEYDEGHPLPGVTVGKSCVMIGDLGQVPLTRNDEAILVRRRDSPEPRLPSNVSGRWCPNGRGGRHRFVQRLVTRK